MNIEEIVEYFKDDIDYLEEELKYPNFKGRYITIRDKECEYLKKLLDYITNLQEENDKFYDETMKDIKEHLIDRIKRQEQEIERLNNIINELEEYSKDRYYEEKKLEHYARLNAYKDILDKLKELKGSDKE